MTSGALEHLVVALTRAGAKDLDTFAPLEEAGARLVHVPLTRQQDVDGGAPLVAALARGEASALVLTSANGVWALERAAGLAGVDPSALELWVVGPGTARAVRKAFGREPDHMPDRATGAALVALATDVGVRGRRFLFPAAAAALATVPDGLRALGAEVAQVSAYETVPDPDATARLGAALEEGLNLAVLASPSAAEVLAAVVAELGEGLDRVPVAAIGPTTEARCRELGLTVAVVAAEHTMAGLASAVVAELAR